MTGFGAVRWIGGGSGAGKSTVAALLGRASGAPVLETDLSLPEHAAAAAGRPAVDAFAAMTMDERWVDREPAEMLRTFPWFVGEAFDLLLDAIRARPEPALVVEGFRLLPELLAPLLAAGGAAVWLLPTPAMRERAFSDRAAHGLAFWERTSDPARALRNLLERDRLFTERLRADCERLGLPTIDVDGSEPAERLAARLPATFHGSGPFRDTPHPQLG